MPVPPSSESSVQRRLRKDEVFEHLLAAILDGSLAPGERLRDTDLQEWLGVSRTPIRMALDRLDSMHLVETGPSRSTRVCRARPDRIPQSIEVMCALWALAARSSLRRIDSVAASTGTAALRRAARVCRGDEPATPPQAVELMRRALYFFSLHADNDLLREMVVRIGADLRFQLGVPGPQSDVSAFAEVFEGLAEAVERRDAETAVDLFESLGASVRASPDVAAGAVSARTPAAGAVA
ncbi:GntR family transcriptional regulator [Frondihabitans australicus]|uniref:DNA-binding GntR family transcriptional regulator n=1 Tax=Frondihabitans australicus TaxID=386892 RepID=A0A495IIX1_9MICO|nr:GntR family transcriptional regulator [Frondihabitans australicus]RKR75719.1 DNA-binding GntR family transcriptional regulator [Frondihabitans australicus]